MTHMSVKKGDCRCQVGNIRKVGRTWDEALMSSARRISGKAVIHCSPAAGRMARRSGHNAFGLDNEFLCAIQTSVGY